MASSYSFAIPRQPAKTTARKVLITGAGGKIGSSLATYAHERYECDLLVHHAESADGIAHCGNVVVGDLGDLPRLTHLLNGIDTVIHLAADASPYAEWESLQHNNIVATYNVFLAAVQAGCRRVVFASSIHAVSGYPVGWQVHPDQAVNPGDLYGVSKCFGEALARMTAEQESVSCIALRIGAFQPREKAAKSDSLAMLDAFVSHRDLNQLICRCIDDTTLQFALFHALSNNRFNRMDITTACELVGYAPDDDFTSLNQELHDLHLRETVRPHATREKNSKALSGQVDENS